MSRTWADRTDARRFRAMQRGFRARTEGLPLALRPPELSAELAVWSEVGWRWRDDQVELARLRAKSEGGGL